MLQNRQSAGVHTLPVPVVEREWVLVHLMCHPTCVVHVVVPCEECTCSVQVTYHEQRACVAAAKGVLSNPLACFVCMDAYPRPAHVLSVLLAWKQCLWSMPHAVAMCLHLLAAVPSPGKPPKTSP